MSRKRGKQIESASVSAPVSASVHALEPANANTEPGAEPVAGLGAGPDSGRGAGSDALADLRPRGPERGAPDADGITITIAERIPQASETELLKKLNQADKRLHQAEMLLSISRECAALEALDDVLRTLIEMTTKELKAERGTLFLNDPVTNELYSRFAQGNFQREIRVLNNTGIVGAVFTSGEGEIIQDAYSDKRFNRTVDTQTGFRTDSIVCVPIKTVRGDVIGVIQALNKNNGEFDEDDLNLLMAMTTQAAAALQSTQFVEKMKKSREKEMEFLDLVSDVTSELDLGALLQRVMAEAARMLQADRATLFLNDFKTNELFSRVAMGDGVGEIRLPNEVGIAGNVFISGTTVNIPYAYADLRFNPAFDKKTGYFTRSMLAVPVTNKNSQVIGVTQVLNRKGGPFTDEDESRLKAFTAQIAVALENAKLFEDVQNMKNYNESMLQSMSNAVITTDEDGKIATCNAAGTNILRVREKDVIGRPADDFFFGPNQWLMEKIQEVDATQEPQVFMDAEISVGPEGEQESINANINVLPLKNEDGKRLGVMVMIEDISSEKRMKSTMSRYMDPGIADRLMGDGGGEDILGGKLVEATVLFSDIRGFTPITEKLGAQGTVAFLNEYFTLMVECITNEEGMLDKFIGDAVMAAFGLPIQHEDDPDRAMRASIEMLRAVREFSEARVKRNELPVDMGIGLNTGMVVSGNIGSPKRMDYTMIGDGVNLAARIESACKQYAARLLISGNTHEKLHGTYRMRQCDLVIVKGKTQPAAIHEVLDYHSKESFPNIQDVMNQFNSGYQNYHEGDWDKAIGCFKDALKANPDDRLSEIFIERCETLIAAPPKEWDGVWRLTSK
ncbi:MAG: GAF domain-containing protein [Rhodospirillales bacterium]